MSDIPNFPSILLRYGRNGRALDPRHAEAVRAFAASEALDDLLVLSHGWNNTDREAMALYAGLAAHLVLQIPSVGGLSGRRIGLLGVIWPSKAFAKLERNPAASNGAASAGVPGADDDDLQALLEELADEASPEARDWLQIAAIAARSDEAAFPKFMQALPAALPVDDVAEGADRALFDPPDPEAAIRMSDTSADTAEADDWELGGGGAAGASGRGLAGAVGNVVNLATFYMMKRRAGLVGNHGLAKTLVGLRQAHPGLRLHMAGHSFGARLVTYATLALNGHPASAPHSLSLLQAAFSHNSFSGSFPAPRGGFFRDVVAKPCVEGPILVTHTHNDWPVTVAYALASRLAGQNFSALPSSEPSQWGGLGSNGAQKTEEAVASELLPPGGRYTLGPGRVFNLRADRFIKGHSDILNDAVGYAIAHAMAAS
ncbi:hypothetical protein SAMN05421759_102150 [Roseivivax lentus]|uniref:Alpha/beta hydrolase n=1 Tax=Roseivivax lentus TaxID=633194 RepID=A0A1N7KXC5_9RHOB|nr:hypothetical protein [Roseivivax lentus]SIS66136.1 hypothetical protein SAMN05421759_102150 [Roseivivax lentus]